MQHCHIASLFLSSLLIQCSKAKRRSSQLTRGVWCCVEWATVLFVIQLSLGESIWSPRWYDYSMSVAPEGREGVFTAMASAPLFLGKFVTGTLLMVLESRLPDSCFAADESALSTLFDMP